MNPREVIYPKRRLRAETLDILCESEQYSIASFIWDNEKRIGIRWNKVKESDIGYPNSRKYPTWFILPKEIGLIIAEKLCRKEILSNLELSVSDTIL